MKQKLLSNHGTAENPSEGCNDGADEFQPPSYTMFFHCLV